jgi:hypothetical protein
MRSQRSTSGLYSSGAAEGAFPETERLSGLVRGLVARAVPQQQPGFPRSDSRGRLSPHNSLYDSSRVHWRRNWQGIYLEDQAVDLAYDHELANGNIDRRNGVPKFAVDEDLALR